MLVSRYRDVVARAAVTAVGRSGASDGFAGGLAHRCCLCGLAERGGSKGQK